MNAIKKMRVRPLLKKKSIKSMKNNRMKGDAN